MQTIIIIILIAAIILGLTCCCKSPQMNLMGVRVSCVSVKLVAALIILIASVMLVAKRDAEAFATTSVDPTCKAGYYLNKATGGCECDSLPDTECPTGMTKLVGTSGPSCVTSNVCPAGTTLKILNGNPFCTANTSCPANSTMSKSGLCQPTACPTGFEILQLTNGSTACVSQPACPAGFQTAKTLDGIVTCSSFPTCPANLVVDQSNNTCIGSVKCPNGGTWDATNKQCVETTVFECGPGFAPSADNKCCLPSPNTYGATCA
jgi:hypothetical protein